MEIDLFSSASSFIQHAYENGWVIKGFDWPNWQEGRDWMNDPDESKYNRIDEEFARKLITALVRQNRYVDGTIEYWLEHAALHKISAYLSRR